METKAEIGKVKEIVEELLKTDERCRNDDKWLTYQVMRKFTNIFIPFSDFEKMPSYETVSRVRRYFQNSKKMYPPTDETVMKRRSREPVFKEEMKS